MNRLWVVLGLVVSCFGGCRCLLSEEERNFDLDENGRSTAPVVENTPDKPAAPRVQPVEVVVASSTDWFATGAQPPAGWTSLNFGARWPHAVINSGTSAELPFPGIWDAPGLTGGSRQVWYRRVFTLDGDPQSAELFAVCNDDMVLYVNEQQVLDDHDGRSTWSHLDVAHALRRGQNVIAATCRDVVPPEHAFHIRLTAMLK